VAEPRYISLDRRFVDYDGPNVTTHTMRTLGARAHRMTLGWADLLTSRYAVVLGEPGSGKTWELRECARSLRASGSHAFFRTVRDLCRSGLAGSLIERDALGAWRTGSGVGLFLLDSLD
jgi:stage III sporulation protein SpoIIIAA